MHNINRSFSSVFSFLADPDFDASRTSTAIPTSTANLVTTFVLVLASAVASLWRWTEHMYEETKRWDTIQLEKNVRFWSSETSHSFLFCSCSSFTLFRGQLSRSWTGCLASSMTDLTAPVQYLSSWCRSLQLVGRAPVRFFAVLMWYLSPVFIRSNSTFADLTYSVLFLL